jgi:hypothetical protein
MNEEDIHPLIRLHDDAEVQQVCEEGTALDWMLANAGRLKREGRFELLLIYMLGGGRPRLGSAPKTIDAWRDLYWQMDLTKSRALGDPLPKGDTILLFRGVATNSHHGTPGFYWSTSLRVAMDYAGAFPHEHQLAFNEPRHSPRVFRAEVGRDEVAFHVNYQSAPEFIAAPARCEIAPLHATGILYRSTNGLPTMEERRQVRLEVRRREKQAEERAQKKAREDAILESRGLLKHVNDPIAFGIAEYHYWKKRDAERQRERARVAARERERSR